ncbi:MAG: ankyrin repeat domain-containing protein [Parachlamydiaceae bacterium]
MESSHPVNHTVPSDLYQFVSEKETPWQISSRLFQRIQAQLWDSETCYKKCPLFQEDMEASFILKYFEQQKPANRVISNVYCIHTPDLTEAFQAHIKVIDRQAETFTPEWHQEGRTEERQKVIQRWKKQAEQFSPVSLKGPRKTETLTRVRVLPLWHGTSAAVCNSIASSGFVHFGKHHFFNNVLNIEAKPGKFESTDPGYFGDGIYFTNSAQYASMYNSAHLILAWVAMREPFPVINDVAHPDKGKDMRKLVGMGAYQTYNAHYIPVAPISPNNPDCMQYYPCYKDQTPACDEIVVFQSPQALPRFWIELGIGLPKAFPSYPISMSEEDQIETPVPADVLSRHFVSSLSYGPNSLEEQKKFILECRADPERRLTLCQLAETMYYEGTIDTFFSTFCEPSPTLTLQLTYLLESILCFLEACRDIMSPIPAITQLIEEHGYQTKNLLWDAPLTNGYPPLLSAVSNNQNYAVQWLITNYPELIEQTTEKHDIAWEDRTHYYIHQTKTHTLPYEGTLYTLAARNNNISLLKWMGKNYFDILKKHAEESLCVAVHEGGIAVIDYLLTTFPSLMLDMEKKITLFKFALKANENTLDFLMQKIPNFDYYFVSYAVKRGHVKTIQTFLKKESHYAQEMLLLAIKVQKKVSVECILGIDSSLITTRDEKGATPFHLAAASGNTAILDVLLKSAPEDLLSATSDNGSNALHYAAEEGQVDTGKWLLERNESLVNGRNQAQQTPLDIANKYKQSTFSDWLQSKYEQESCIIA